MSQTHDIEHIFIAGPSRLEVICGPMFSGKTEELIRRIRRVEYARMRAIVFKPEIDARFAKDLVVSHSAQKIGSVPVPDVSSMRKFLNDFNKRFHVVGLDEVQFFSGEVVDFCEELVAEGVRVIAAGLCQDYLARPFGPMPDLLAHADSVTKLWAVCMRCGAPASRTQRIREPGKQLNENQIAVGANESYEARCRSCHKKIIVELSEGLQISDLRA